MHRYGLSTNCIIPLASNTDAHIATHFVPQRYGVGHIGRLLDHSSEFCFGNARYDLRETKTLIVDQVVQNLESKGSIARGAQRRGRGILAWDEYCSTCSKSS